MMTGNDAFGSIMKSSRLMLQLPNWSMGFACLIGALFLAAPAPVAAAEQETPADIITIQIRKQGFPCDNPQKADRDRKASKPDEAVWVLQCGNATYRVRLIPDMAAHVERIN